MNDNVNHPKHYTGFSNGSEVIDITENCTFNTGNAIKYAARAGRTDGNTKGAIVEDLQKARWYIDREIDRVTKTVEPVTPEPLQERVDRLTTHYDKLLPGTTIRDKTTGAEFSKGSSGLWSTENGTYTSQGVAQYITEHDSATTIYV